MHAYVLITWLLEKSFGEEIDPHFCFCIRFFLSKICERNFSRICRVFFNEKEKQKRTFHSWYLVKCKGGGIYRFKFQSGLKSEYSSKGIFKDAL